MYFSYGSNILSIVFDSYKLRYVYMAKFKVFETNNVWVAGCRNKWACKEKH